ncbi:hypothetical protein LINPERHAP2_LOCUS38583 [Linum perenne]
MIFFLKEELKLELPTTIMWPRWSKNIKSQDHTDDNSIVNDVQRTALMYGLLQHRTLALFDLGSHPDHAYNQAKTKVDILCEELLALGDNISRRPHARVADEFRDDVDLDGVRYKGCGDVKLKKGVDKRRRCDKCGELGHKRPTCNKIHISKTTKTSVEAGPSKTTRRYKSTLYVPDTREDVEYVIWNSSESEDDEMPPSTSTYNDESTTIIQPHVS